MPSPVLNRSSIEALMLKMENIAEGREGSPETHIIPAAQGLTDPAGREAALELLKEVYQNLADGLSTHMLEKPIMNREDFALLAGYAVGAIRDKFIAESLRIQGKAKDTEVSLIRFDKDLGLPIARSLMGHFDNMAKEQSRFTPPGDRNPGNN